MALTLGKVFELQDLLDRFVRESSASDDPLEAVAAAVWLRDHGIQAIHDAVWIRVNEALEADQHLQDVLAAGPIGVTGFYRRYRKALARNGITPARRPWRPMSGGNDPLRDALVVPDEVSGRREVPLD